MRKKRFPHASNMFNPIILEPDCFSLKTSQWYPMKNQYSARSLSLTKMFGAESKT